MPPEESQYPRDWLRVAGKDWRRMSQALDDGDAEEAGFWLQQAMDSPLLTLEEVSGSRDEIVELVELIRPGLR